MKSLILNHELTPDSLADVNVQLTSVLQAQELDDSELKRLIERRDVVILQHIDTLSEKEKEEFARLEWPINQTLSSLVEKQLSDSLKQLSGLLRGRKAVNKYK